MQGVWYLFNFMVVFSVSPIRKGGWDCSKSQILFALFTQPLTLTTTGLWKGFGLNSYCVNYLYKPVSLFILLSSQTVTCMLPDEMCDRQQQRCESSKRNINSDQWIQIKNKILTKQSLLLAQLLGNWSRKIYTELFRQYLSRICIDFPRNEKVEKNLWYLVRQFVCKSWPS